MQIDFSVPGRPSRWMRPGEATGKDGRTYRFTDKKAEAGKRHIADCAAQAFRGIRPASGPVIIRVIAIFEIPKSWPVYLRKAAAECRVMHVQDPDLDQLVKQVKDALKGIAYVDDNQVCGYANHAKRYGAPERTEITVQVLPQKEDEITPGQRRLEDRIAKEGWDAVLAPIARKKKSSKANSGGLFGGPSGRRRP